MAQYLSGVAEPFAIGRHSFLVGFNLADGHKVFEAFFASYYLCGHILAETHISHNGEEVVQCDFVDVNGQRLSHGRSTYAYCLRAQVLAIESHLVAPSLLIFFQKSVGDCRTN